MRGGLAAAVALFVVCFAPSSIATTSGLRGLVTRSPAMPVCQAGIPCSAPAKHLTLTFTRGALARSVTTGDDGRYRIALPAGMYTVKIATARFGYSPRTAAVPAGRVAVRNFQIDTGIR